MSGPLGVILAGGESRRYGAPKALAEVAGRRIIDRVVEALAQVCEEQVIIANDPTLFGELGLPQRPDVRPGLGALGGILTGLAWAGDRGAPGIVAVACDMPFLSVPLLRRIRQLAFDDPGAPDVVVPASRSRRSVEPLCAAYGLGCVPAIEAQLARGESHVIGFFEDVRVHRIPLEEVEALCDPGRAFLNVNTPAERDRAERLARDAAGGASHAR